MNETPMPNKGLDEFVNSLLPETNLSPTAIADKFSLYHQLSSPPSYQSIITACLAFVNEIEQKSNLPNAIRGFHCTYNNHTQLILRDHEQTGAIAHTLLHEIFEIIIERLNEKIKPTYKLTPYKANLFAASVLMPEEVFFEQALKSDLDFLAIHRDHERYIHYSYLSLLLRLQYLFGLNKICYLAIIAENKKAHYQHKDINNLSNFKIIKVIHSRKNSITFDYNTLLEYLSRCYSGIIAQKDEKGRYTKSVTLEEGDFLIKASPVPFRYYNSHIINRIVMQIIPKEDYEAILRKVVKP